MIADVNAEGAAAAAAALGKDGITAASCAGDVGNKVAADAMVSSAVTAFGALDVLVANAGIVRACDFLEMSEVHCRVAHCVVQRTVARLTCSGLPHATQEDFDEVIRVNLKGVFLVRHRHRTQKPRPRF